MTDFDEFLPRFDEAHLDLEKKVAAITKTSEKSEPPKEPTDTTYLRGKQGIPDFWVKAWQNNKLMWDHVKENDKAILASLKHVEAEQSESDSKNIVLSLKMTFHENDYFTPEVLVAKLEY